METIQKYLGRLKKGKKCQFYFSSVLIRFSRVLSVMDSNTYASLNHASSSASLEVATMSSAKQFFGLKISTRIFAIVEILLGIVLISMEVATMMLIPAANPMFIIHKHFMGLGILAAVFYIASGSLLVEATRNQRNRSLLVATVVMTALSFFVSIGATFSSGLVTLAGIATAINEHPVDFSHSSEQCVKLELILLLINILSHINSIVLVTLASVGLCLAPRKSPYVRL